MNKRKAAEILARNILILDQGFDEFGCIKIPLGLISISNNDACEIYGFIAHPKVCRKNSIRFYLIKVDGKYYFRTALFEVFEVVTASMVINNYEEYPDK